MTTIRFTDGVEVHTSGPLRRLELHDGLYVVGNSMLIPCESEAEVREMLEGELANSPSSGAAAATNVAAEEDPLRAARGIAVALAIAAVMWAVIAAVWALA